MLEKFNTYTLFRPRLKKMVGWLVVLIGFLGIVLPILPGWILIFIGIEILGFQFVFIDKLKSLFVRQFANGVPQPEKPVS